MMHIVFVKEFVYYSGTKGVSSPPGSFLIVRMLLDGVKTDKPTGVILRSLPFLGRDQTIPSLPLGPREVFLGIRIGTRLVL
jgi:hypothetical protein